jgi:capsular exopolysaccharide synthesis family protein
MELRDYLQFARRRAWVIVGVTLLCAVSAFSASVMTVPVYQGTAKLFVTAKSDPRGGTAAAYEGALLSQQLVISLGQILQSRVTAEAALRLDPQPITPRQLQQRIHAEPVAETLLIDLRVEDTDPGRAKRLTNSVARAFIMEMPTLQGGSALRVSLVEPALRPMEPVRPRTKLNVTLALIFGLLLGIGLALLREFLDRSIKAPEELEAGIGIPVVGTIPPFKANKQPIPVAEQPRTAVAEAFRKLRTNFAFLGVDRQNPCCVVTSPAAGDGKSTVAANLAIALAQAGQRVVIVDADLRKPTLHKLFGLQQRVGATTVLLDRVGLHDAVQHLGPEMPSVLTSGQLPPNPAELLGSRRMEDLLAELRAAYDVVLVDCAPMLPVTDPMVVSRFADGILLIARAGSTTRDQLQAATAVSSKAGAKLFGAVLNAALVGEGDQSTYYSYYGENGGHRRTGVQEVAINLASNEGHPAAGSNRSARHSRISSRSQ